MAASGGINTIMALAGGKIAEGALPALSRVAPGLVPEASNVAGRFIAGTAARAGGGAIENTLLNTAQNVTNQAITPDPNNPISPFQNTAEAAKMGAVLPVVMHAGHAMAGGNLPWAPEVNRTAAEQAAAARNIAIPIQRAPQPEAPRPVNQDDLLAMNPDRALQGTKPPATAPEPIAIPINRGEMQQTLSRQSDELGQRAQDQRDFQTHGVVDQAAADAAKRGEVIDTHTGELIPKENANAVQDAPEAAQVRPGPSAPEVQAAPEVAGKNDAEVKASPAPTEAPKPADGKGEEDLASTRTTFKPGPAFKPI